MGSTVAPLTRIVFLPALLFVSLVAGPSRAEVAALPRARWPASLEQAVPLILAAMNTAQKSIVMGTSQENLFLLQGEWGEDIKELLGLNTGNAALPASVCGQPCKPQAATILLMEAAWRQLQLQK